MTFANKYGPWAIVVGAAEGLGEAYSTELAKRKISLIMIDYQESALNNLSNHLEEVYGIRTKTLYLDLSEKNAADQIMNITKSIDAGLLVYNAAYSLIKPFIDHTAEELDTFINVNALTQIQLALAFSKRLINQKRNGGILLMSSLAGLVGMQLVAPYAATKAFAWNLAEALYHDLRPYQIDVTACIAGVTDTPAFRRSKPNFGFFRPKIMRSEDVAIVALNNLGKKARFIPGFSNRMNYFILTRIMPRKIAASIANKTMKKIYSNRTKKN